MRTHVIIIYGCDDRYDLVKDTVEVSHNYFDVITIYNCGVREFTDKFMNLPSNCKIEYYDGFFGDMESVLRGAIKNIDEGDWFMWLDADERPSPLMLSNIKSDVKYLEDNNYNFCRFPSLAHCHGKTWRKMMEFPDYEGYKKSPTTPSGFIYAAPKFVKKDKLYIQSNFGVHYNYHSANGDRDYYFPHPVNHIKTKAQEFQSMALKSYTNPVNDFQFSKHFEILDSQEYKRLRDFQRDTGVKTSPQLFIKVNVEKDAEFIAKYKKLLESYLDSKLWTFKVMSGLLDWGSNFDTVIYKCGRDCCKYGDLQL